VTEKDFVTDPQLDCPELFGRRQRQTYMESFFRSQRPAPGGSVSRSVADFHGCVFERTSHQQMDSCFIPISDYAHCGVQVCGVRNADLSNGIPILAEALGLSRRKKGKIRLIVCINTGHKLYVRTIRVGEAAVPGIAKLMVSPGPLLLAR
jgi:hypothetical protein